MSDIAHKLEQSYHLAGTEPEHPIRRAVAEIRRLRVVVEKLTAERDGWRTGAELALAAARSGEKLQEIGARVDGMSPEEWRDGLRKVMGLRPLDAAPPPAPAVSEPDGWLLVPMVATPAMIEAGCDRINDVEDAHCDKPVGLTAMRAAWVAMLAAAPRPPQQGE